MRTLPILMLAAAAGCTAPKAGVLVMAHGGDQTWNRDVQAAVEPLRSKYATEIAFGMARTSTMRAAVERLEDQGVRRIAVVRVFVSGDSFIEPTEVILGLRDASPTPPRNLNAQRTSRANPHALHASHETNGGDDQTDRPEHHMEPPERIDTVCSFVLSRAGVGESPLVDEILVDRVRALSTEPSHESVLILAHGPADEAENERWLASMRLRTQRIHEIGPFRHVEVETLREDWPERRVEAERRIRQYVESGSADGGRVIVVPFRIAGFGPYARVLEGLDYVADGRGFCPHPNLTRWIEQTAEECLARDAINRR